MATKAKGRARRWQCKRCGAAIRVPKDWTSPLPAVRKHYWAKHPEVMQPKRGKR